METTERLKLKKPTVDSEVESAINEYGNNFQKIDDAFDETILDLDTFLSVGEVYKRGKKFWRQEPIDGGRAGWANIRTGVFAPRWVTQKTYNVGDVVIATPNNGHYYQCISGGTSAVTQPSFPTVSGSTINDLDRHTIWTPSYQYLVNDIVVSTVGDKSYYYKCISSGTSGTIEPNWSNISGSTIIDGSVQWYVYKTIVWKEMGSSCEFVDFGIVGDYKGEDTISEVGKVVKGEWKSNPISIEHGGTGANNAIDARKNIGAVSKYSEVIGDSMNVSYTINHNLDTEDVVVYVRETSLPASVVNPEVIVINSNSVIVEFEVAPTNNKYKVTVIG